MLNEKTRGKKRKTVNYINTDTTNTQLKEFSQLISSLTNNEYITANVVKKYNVNEPDEETADGIMQLLSGINKEKGTTVIIVTHNRGIFERYPGRVFVCRDERCEETRNDEVIELAFTI